MTEILFILTTVFVAYVVYSIVDEHRLTDKTVVTELKPEVKTVAEPAKPLFIAPEKQATSATKAPTALVFNTANKGSVRDPKTGQIAAITSNYRFTKRWVKEALVTEGLLEKIYKNNELNADADALIKTAFIQLEMLDKYRV
jgi:hypothetical protein